MLLRRSLLALALLATGCSLITPLDDLLGDAGAADAPGDLEVVDGKNGPCACVDVPPVGFSGPVATWTGSGTAPACDARYPATAFDGFYGPEGAPATCACACGSAAGVTCPTTISAKVYANDTCTGNACNSFTLGTSCDSTIQAGCNAGVAGIETTITPSGGSCTPQPTNTVPASSWDAGAHVCEAQTAPAQGACSAGQVCAPLAAAPYETHPCIVGVGDLACPASYSQKRVFYTGVTDTRGCSTCTCQPRCMASLLAGCVGSGIKLPSDTCVQLSDPVSLKLNAAPTPDTCLPQGGQATGALTGTQATTVCCVP